MGACVCEYTGAKPENKVINKTYFRKDCPASFLLMVNNQTDRALLVHVNINLVEINYN